jgi:hypothetical protein
LVTCGWTAIAQERLRTPDPHLSIYQCNHRPACVVGQGQGGGSRFVQDNLSRCQWWQVVGLWSTPHADERTQSRFLKLHTQESRLSLSLINHQHMHPYPLTLSRHLRWTNQMVENRGNKETQSSLSQTLHQSIAASHKKWHSLMGIQKVFIECLRNAGSMFLTYVPNAHQFVQSKAWGVAWPISLASRKISSTRYQCSRLLFTRQDMSASSCWSCIVSSIQLKWWVTVIGKFDPAQLGPSSIGAGASTATAKLLRRHFKMQKMPFRNIWMPVPLRSFATLSIGHGGSWVHIDGDWQGEQLHGQSIDAILNLLEYTQT